MNNKEWLQYTDSLNGELVELIPLSTEHFNELIELAKEKRIWEFIPADCSTTEKIRTILVFLTSTV